MTEERDRLGAKGFFRSDSRASLTEYAAILGVLALGSTAVLPQVASAVIDRIDAATAAVVASSPAPGQPPAAPQTPSGTATPASGPATTPEPEAEPEPAGSDPVAQNPQGAPIGKPPETSGKPPETPGKPPEPPGKP